MKEKENVLRILEETKIALKKEAVVKLKELSDQTIHTASVSQDPDNILVAVLVYSLAKIVGRNLDIQNPNWKKFYEKVRISIDNSIKSLKNNDDKSLNLHLKEIRKAIDKSPVNLRNYISDVFTKAKINKASKIYEHGISMEKTASLLGITMFDLAGYTGQKNVVGGANGKTISARDRIKFAMDIFE